MAAYELAERLVIGVASSALFDLTESDRVFAEEGQAAYRIHQQEHLDDTLSPGVAFPFVRRLLSLNDLRDDPGDPLVEVIVLSRNSPDTGLRVMRSIAARGLPITRAIFTEGKAPFRYMTPLNMALFLSANADDVRRAVADGLPAGHVQASPNLDDDLEDRALRVAFDFDAVLADDSSEQIYQRHGLHGFQAHERANGHLALGAGPLRELLRRLNQIQAEEERRRCVDPEYRTRLHVSVVTARSAPAHERALLSLREWGLHVNDAFFLGGIAKAPILETLRPHIFFDDQQLHLTSESVPSVHIPFGVNNVTGAARPRRGLTAPEELSASDEAVG